MRSEQIKQLLPGVFQRAVLDRSPLHALLDAMEVLHEPAETAIREFPDNLDPRHAPDWLVPMLARWVDLDRLFEPPPPGREPTLAELYPAGLGRLRELIARATELSKRRGTRQGMLDFLNTATGLSGFTINDAVVDPATGEPRPFHLRIHAPEAARPYASLLKRIIASEKPAYVTHELQIGDELQQPAKERMTPATT